jgi:hypothetical protein
MGQDPSEVRREVEAARDQLGATVEAIVHRANAPKRAKENVAEKISSVVAKVDPRKPDPEG